MKKKWYAVIFFVLTLSAAYFLLDVKAKQNKKYNFKKLNSETAARIEFKNTNEKTWDIPFSIVLDDQYNSLYKKKQELIFVQIYKQFIQSSLDSVFTLGMKPLERPIIEVLAQYGEKYNSKKEIYFSQSQDLLLTSKSLRISWQNLNTNKVHIRAVETQMLNVLVARINSLIRYKSVRTLALENKMTMQDYMNSVVNISEVKLEAEEEWVRVHSTYQNKKLESKKDRAAYITAAEERIRNKKLDDIIFANFLKLPISVNIELPVYENTIKWDWTPYVNAKTDNQIRIMAFTDFFNPASRDVVSRLYKRAVLDKKIQFGWHPFFINNDRFDTMFSEFALCVWKNDPKNFWIFLNRIHNVEKNNFEKESFSLIKDLKLNVEKIRSCFLARESKEIVEYHLKLGRYLEVINAPVVLVDKEVFVGPVSEIDIQLSIDRQR